MKSFLLGVVVLAATALLPNDASAFGRKHRGCGHTSSCATTTCSSCGSGSAVAYGGCGCGGSGGVAGYYGDGVGYGMTGYSGGVAGFTGGQFTGGQFPPNTVIVTDANGNPQPAPQNIQQQWQQQQRQQLGQPTPNVPQDRMPKIP